MSAPTWIPFNGVREGGRCDVCRAVATAALVRFDHGVAFTLLRSTCRAHWRKEAES
jgi:hypothetical protein